MCAIPKNKTVMFKFSHEVVLPLRLCIITEKAVK